MAKEGGRPPIFLPWSITQVHAVLASPGFLEAYYTHHISMDAPTIRPWTPSSFAPEANYTKSCRLVYVAKSSGSLWCMRNSVGGKNPNETVDTLEAAWCPGMARLTLTAATDMLVSNGGKGSQAVRMWAKQWSFTDSSSRDGCAGCTVFGTANSRAAMLDAALRQVEDLTAFLRSYMSNLSAHGRLMSRKDAEALMTGPRPGSPQSTGSPGTPQQTSALRHDFLRADLTPLDDIPPLKSDPAHSVPDQTLTGANGAGGSSDHHNSRLSASDYEALRIGQPRQRLQPSLKPTEAARIFISAEPRMSPVQEEPPHITADHGPHGKPDTVAVDKVVPQSVEKGRSSPVSVMWWEETQHGVPGPPTSISARTSASTLSEAHLRVCLSPGGHRSISEEPLGPPLSPKALGGPLKFRASLEDGGDTGKALFDARGSAVVSGTQDIDPYANLAIPQLPRIAIKPEVSSPLQPGPDYPPLSSQMGVGADPAQALTTMMEVAVETVNTVAQIAMETVHKMSAVTIEQLNDAAQHAEQRRGFPNSPVHRATGSTLQLLRQTGHSTKPSSLAPSAAENHSEGKVWDVRASQNRTLGTGDFNNSFTGSTVHLPSDLQPEDEAFIHGGASAQALLKGAGTPGPSTQSRPAIVPLLWQGSSPFEYRGLETESICDETPRGTPVALPGLTAADGQDVESGVMLQGSVKTPPLLKRAAGKAAERQGPPDEQHAEAEMGARPADEAKQAPTQAANGKQQKADDGDAADSAVAKMSDPSSETRGSKLRKIFHSTSKALDCSKARRSSQLARGQQAAGKKSAEGSSQSTE